MRKTIVTKLLTGMLAAALLVSAAGCSSATETQAQTDVQTDGETGTKSTVKMAVSSEPDNLNPMLSSATDTSAIMMNVYEGLLSFDSEGSFIPALAESYEIADGGLTYRFTLKEGITFHNGEEFDSGDVKYTYETLAGLNGEAPLNQTLSAALASVETPDAHTVELKLKQADAGFLSKCIISIQEEGYSDDSTVPVGTGPYKFKEYIQGQKIVLEKNPDYKTIESRTPEIDTVEFRIMTDSSAVLMALKSGDLDIASIDARNAEALGDGFQTIEGPQNMVQLFALNNSVAPLNDVRVRQAICMAVDKDEIIQTVMDGHGTRLESFLSPSMKNYYNDEIKGYDTDTEKARELLAQAGYPDGFQMTITVPSNYQTHIDTAQLLKSQLEKIGVQADIQLIEWAQWLEDVYNNADYEATVIGHSGKLDPQDFLSRFTTTYSHNYFKYANPSYDEKVARAASVTDTNQRAELYKECQQILVDDAASVFIQDPSILYAVNSKLSGMQIYPVTFFDMGSLRLA